MFQEKDALKFHCPLKHFGLDIQCHVEKHSCFSCVQENLHLGLHNFAAICSSSPMLDRMLQIHFQNSRLLSCSHLEI